MTTEPGTLNGAGLSAFVSKINALVGVIAASGMLMAVIEIGTPGDRGVGCSYGAALPWCVATDTSADRDHALLKFVEDRIAKAQGALDTAQKEGETAVPALEQEIAGLEAERATLSRAIGAASDRPGLQDR
jgi:hypothetical protein